MHFSGLLHFPKPLQKTLCFKDPLMVLPEHMIKFILRERSGTGSQSERGLSSDILILLYHQDHGQVASGLELLQDLLHAEPVAALQGTTSTLLPSAQGTAHNKSCSPASPGRAAHCTGHTSLCSYLSFSNLHVVVTRLLIKQHNNGRHSVLPKQIIVR